MILDNISRALKEPLVAPPVTVGLRNQLLFIRYYERSRAAAFELCQQVASALGTECAQPANADRT